MTQSSTKGASAHQGVPHRTPTLERRPEPLFAPLYQEPKSAALIQDTEPLGLKV